MIRELGRDHRIAGGQEVAHARVGDDAIDESIHLGEPGGRERLPTEDEREDTDVARVPEKLIDLSNRFADGVPGRKECQGCTFYHRRAPGGPCAQGNGDDEEDEKRDVWAGCDQPGQPTEYLAYGRPF